MCAQGYKKYMKKNVRDNHTLLKIFLLSFTGMLLICLFIMKSLPTADTSVGDYNQESIEDMSDMQRIDNDRLQMIQSEDQGRNFTEIMNAAEKTQTPQQTDSSSPEVKIQINVSEEAADNTKPAQEPVYKVFIGTYTSAEQARVAKDIIQESGIGLNPIVKCIGVNDYTLQVGIFKNKKSAESLLYSVQQNHLPGRIVQDY